MRSVLEQSATMASSYKGGMGAGGPSLNVTLKEAGSSRAIIANEDAQKQKREGH